MLFDGGDLEGSIESPVFRLKLPPAWSHGLEETIGYDPETRTVRLTSDADSNPVAFLGRAHPLVRRALDRVRSITYGSGIDALQDHRVSAVQRAVPAPELLFTFLGRVASRAGRELERVIGVRLPQAGQPQVLLDAGQWSAMADPECGIRTVQVWETFFRHWAGNAQTICRSAAATHFASIAKDYSGMRRTALEKERGELDSWLAVRAKQITGDVHSAAVQTQLFTAGQPAAAPPAAWADVSEPAERLARFYADSTQPHAARSEADGVLRLYRQRIADLDAHIQLLEPEIVPLGLLMIVPEGAACR